MATAESRPCPICGRPVKIPENRAKKPSSEPSLHDDGAGAFGLFPFCSSRCRLIDLGRWIDGEYRIPGESIDGSQEDLP